MMGFALTEEQVELAEAVTKFAQSVAPGTAIRAEEPELAAGAVGSAWEALTDFGLHALAIPELLGGQGGKLDDLAVAAESLAAELFPGPFLPTVIVSTLTSLAGESAVRDAALADFVGGATAAVVEVEAGGVVVSDNWSGVSRPALGARAALWYLVKFAEPSGSRFALVRADRAGLSLRGDTPTDRSRDAAAVAFDQVRLAGEDFLVGLPEQTFDTVQTALYAAESAGVMRWASTSATGYAKVREQFGQPIGGFQATKHKLARLFISAELASAAAWSAAMSISEAPEQQALACGAAALRAIAQAPDAVTEAITVFGGIGFTWEHDAHRYLRRALSVAAAAGSATARAQQLGRDSLTTQRQAEFELADEDPDFREEIRALLAEAAVLADAPQQDGERSFAAASTGARRTFLADHGLVSSHWPAPYGRGASPTEQIVIAEEFERAGLVQPSTVIGEWAVPTILGHGTPEQHERFAPATLRGEIVWCQLFSEPGAGSDLAGLNTRATKTDGGWTLQGQKVWTSGAHEADWGICLARTDPEALKHRGLSYFLVDMRSPGIDVRPLVQSTGEAHFNEVFLDEVFVPDDCLVGAPGEGWRITATTLANERTTIASGMTTGAEVPLKELLTGDTPVASRDAALGVLGDLVSQSISVGALNLRETLRRVSGMQPGTGSSVAKVASADLARSAALQLAAISASAAMLQNANADPARELLGLPSVLLGGGTVEIQLNIIAERILMLPR